MSLRCGSRKFHSQKHVWTYYICLIIQKQLTLYNVFYMDQQIYRANKFKFLGSKNFLLCSGIILHYPNPNNTVDISLFKKPGQLVPVSFVLLELDPAKLTQLKMFCHNIWYQGSTNPDVHVASPKIFSNILVPMDSNSLRLKSEQQNINIVSGYEVELGLKPVRGGMPLLPNCKERITRAHFINLEAPKYLEIF